MAKLTKQQIEAIKRQLDESGELPPEWRWDIFPPEKQEYELVYADKQREEDIIAQTMAVPLQTVRTFNNGSGRPQDGKWYNRLIFGENLQALKSLSTDPTVAGKVKLIYIDPPFATKQDFKGSKDQKAYQDKVYGAEFIEFIRKRLVILQDILAIDGSIFVHLDIKKSHYIKTILDEVFGESNFRNEIIWKRSTAHSDSSTYANLHDTVFFYSKSQVFNFIQIYTEYTDDYIKERYKHINKDGRRFLDRDLSATGLKGGGYIYEWKGKKQKWRCPLGTMKRYEKEDRLYYTRNGVARYKQFMDEMPGVALQDIWTDINAVNSQAAERVDYPTQKPESLLNRLIKSTTNENDLILDAFAGSGTTCAVAEKLNRRWIGIDAGKLATYVIQKRMLNLKMDIGNKGKKLKAKPFVLQNAGLYDFETLKDLPWEDWRFFALQLFECKDKPQKIGGLQLDGEKGRSPVLVYDWKTNPGQTISEETIEDIHAMVGKKIGKKFYIIAPMMAFDFFQDYIDLDGIRYYALRIPYSMIQELHKKDFEAVLQAREEGNVNDIQEAYGFSFMVAPEVQWEAKTEIAKNELFPWAIIKTKKFSSKAIIKGTEQQGSFETLAMLMIDLDYDGNIFDLDIALYGEELEKSKWTARFSPKDIGEQVMAIWVDHHGNESKAVISRDEFGLSSIKCTNATETKKKVVQKKTAKKKITKKTKR